MAALANPMVMLMELRLLRVQLVPVKIMPITDATVSPQVEGINISFDLIHVFLHSQVFHMHSYVPGGT
jgi:hypothetical protein